jgi:hypothetical protein
MTLHIRGAGKLSGRRYRCRCRCRCMENDALHTIATRIFDAHAHTIYVANILWGAWAILGCLVGYYYRARIIPYLSDISLTPYPNPHLQTIGFILSISAWISKTLLHMCIIRIWIGSNAEIIYITFIPYHMKFLLQ